MPLTSTCRMLSVLALLALTLNTAQAGEPPVIRSKQTGAWSDGEHGISVACRRAETWSSFAELITSPTT